MIKTRLLVGVVIVVLIILGFVVFNKPSNITGGVINNNVPFSGETKEFTIEAFRFSFNPSTIEVNQGDKVKITAYSKDVPHGLSIPGYGVNLYLDGLKEQTAEFIADKKGTFRFYCSVPCGSGHSTMGGQLIVR